MILSHTIKTNPDDPNETSVQQNNCQCPVGTQLYSAVNILYQALALGIQECLTIDILHQALTSETQAPVIQAQPDSLTKMHLIFVWNVAIFGT